MLSFFALKEEERSSERDGHNRRYKNKRERKEQRGVYGMLWKDTIKFAKEMLKDSPRASLHEAVAAA
ncbi:hypothetical protein NC653_033834 [Populus alba x Populus x berolinensis]|uniref:Uncharacterized protein n=1 Tax=Populus alba x Populus x berolinensis TaxID=444605 RepID=A0AAD6LUZ1_9ROSI|nr:hypothetical protein NC653_033834 [Populus alba x Populus x berolinensis]